MKNRVIEYIEKLEKATTKPKKNHKPINYHSYYYANLERALSRTKITKHQFDKQKADFEEENML